jgi:spermidine synthase
MSRTAPLFPLAPALFFSLALAASGILYELALAQLLAVVVGGTLVQYSLTIGLFTLALGASSLAYPLLPAALRSARAFIGLQLATAVIGVASTFLLEELFRAGAGFPAWLLPLAYLPVFLVGLLTGLELPILLEARGARARSACLGADYAGMFLATLAFPLLLLPAGGPHLAAILAAALNAAVALGALALRERAA